MRLELQSFFDRSDIFLTPNLGLTDQLLPLPLHPPPDFPGQTHCQFCPFLQIREQLLCLFHGFAGRFQNMIPLTDLRVLFPEIRYRIFSGAFRAACRSRAVAATPRCRVGSCSFPCRSKLR